jgi:alpha-N-arabinofuranosidase
MIVVSATLSIAGSAPVTPIRRNIYGYFIEHFHRLIYGGIFDPGSSLSDERGFRMDVAEALRELGVGVVRWPGGCFVSAYHWADGIGPERSPRFDKAWRVDEPNTFGTAEFIQWCELVGATPYICTNAGTGTAEEMSDWLEYCNSSGSGRWAQLRREHGSDAPFNVPFWSIGNENYGSWELGAKSAVEWARFVTESAKMMRRVDPDVQLLTAARADLEWTLPLLESAGPYLDAVAIHGYWDALWVDDNPSNYLTAVGRSMDPENDIRTMRSILRAAGYDDTISIAFDEWNLRGWHHPPGGVAAIAARGRNDRHETYTMADAVFSAGFLNGCLRNADVVSMANLAPLANGRGPLYVDGRGLVRRTTYHVMRMYSQLLGSEYVPSTGTSITLDCGDRVSIPAVDAVATRKGDDLAIALVNRHPDAELECVISIDGAHLNGVTAQRTTLAGDSTDAYNSPEDPDRVLPVTTIERMDAGLIRLPAHSVSILVVPQSVAPAVGEWVRGHHGHWRKAAPGLGRDEPRVDWAF